MTKKWYSIHTTPNYEKKVKERIIQRAQQEGLSDCIGEIFIPTEEVSEVKNGKKTTTERRLFSGYLFIEMDFSDQVWHLIRKTPNVTSFVGGSNQSRPVAIPPSDIQSIRDRISKTQDKPAPKVIYEKGLVVRIKDGPFKDFTGAVDEVYYDKAKLRLMVTVFGRETPVEVGFSDIEKTL